MAAETPHTPETDQVETVQMETDQVDAQPEKQDDVRADAGHEPSETLKAYTPEATGAETGAEEAPMPGDTAEEEPTTDAQPDAPDAQSEDEESWQTQYLRLAADYDNFRKRTLREREQERQRAKEDLLLALLPVLDNLERALESASTTENLEAIQKGLGGIQRKLNTALAKQNLERMTIEPGDDFDAEEHDALDTQPSEAYAAGQIIMVVEPGYRFNGRVIRHAKVVVAQ